MKRREFLKGAAALVPAVAVVAIPATDNGTRSSQITLPEEINGQTPGWAYDPMLGIHRNPTLSAAMLAAASQMATAMTWQAASKQASKKHCEWVRSYAWGSWTTCDYDDAGEEVPGTRRTFHSDRTGASTRTMIIDMATTLATTRRARWIQPIELRLAVATDFGRSQRVAYYGRTVPV